MREEQQKALVSPEIFILGEYEQRPIPVKHLILLSQVRAGMNPDYMNIYSSMKTNGLLNPIDIAMMDEFQFADYIAFTNSLWGTDTSIEEFEDQIFEGYYPLVIAGHTRTKAAKKLEDEDVMQRTFAVMSKIHKISDPSEIISLQLDENLHSKPPMERQAMAIVESYEYGKLYGKWTTPNEFARLNKDKFSKKILADALGFARLPDQARDFVFSGNLSYTAAVEIGRATETILDNVSANLGINFSNDLADSQMSAFKNAYNIKISTLIGHIQADGLNTSAAKKYILGQVTLLKENSAKIRGEMDDSDSLFDMSMLDSDGQEALYLKELRKELWQEHQKIARLAGGGDTILRIHETLTSVDTEAARETHRRSIGRIAGALATSLDVA